MILINKKYTKISYRKIRISEVLQKELSIIFQRNLRDPRINFMTTISMVKLSQDLSYAKIFISYLESYTNLVNNFSNKNNIQEIIEILQNASSYIRKILCKKIRLRKIPYLTFYHDNSLIEGMKIINLLKYS